MREGACSIVEGECLGPSYASFPVPPLLSAPRLSEVVCEELDESLAVPPLLPLQELAPGVTLQAVQERLRSAAFARAAYSVHSAHSSLLRGMQPLTFSQVCGSAQREGACYPSPSC